jgi:hypothetical protein
MRPPGGVYLTAFDSRLETISRRYSSLLQRRGRSAGMSRSRVTPRSAAAGTLVSTASSTSWWTATAE